MKRVFGLRANRRLRSRHELLEGDAARLGGGAAREERQLQPALVVEVVRREERLRLGGVDEHRDVEARRRLPDRIELGVVDLQARAVGLLDVQAEALGDLADADRAGGDVGLELLHGALGPARSDAAAGRCRRRRGSDPCAGWRRWRRACALRRVARLVVGADQHPDVERVHGRDDAGDPLGGRQVARVAMDVDHRVLRLRHRVLLGDERRRRPVVDDARRRLRRRLAVARPDFGHAGGALAVGVGRRAAATGALAGEQRSARGNRKEQRDHQGSLRHRA